jgi:CO/xanthine dehydrogenase FAD-binding subunit
MLTLDGVRMPARVADRLGETEVIRPECWTDVLAAHADRPDATLMAGGTDVLPRLEAGRIPPALLDLGRVHELAQWRIQGRYVRLGAAVPYTRIIRELADRLPALTAAAASLSCARTRDRATLGGNLGSASPAGDAHPALLAGEALIETASTRFTRIIPAADFYTGPRATRLARDEVIAAVLVRPAEGPQQFVKVVKGSVRFCFALGISPHGRRVRTGIGRITPIPCRARAAELFLENECTQGALWWSRESFPDAMIAEFGRLVAAEVLPPGNGERRRAIAAVARHVLRRTWGTWTARSSAYRL